MGVAIKDFLKARRDRALGSILGYAEREVFPQLTPAQRTSLRSVTLDALNSYHDSVLDLMKSETGSVRNEEIAAILTRVEDQLNRL